MKVSACVRVRASVGIAPPANGTPQLVLIVDVQRRTLRPHDERLDCRQNAVAVSSLVILKVKSPPIGFSTDNPSPGARISSRIASS